VTRLRPDLLGQFTTVLYELRGKVKKKKKGQKTMDTRE